MSVFVATEVSVDSDMLEIVDVSENTLSVIRALKWKHVRAYVKK